MKVIKAGCFLIDRNSKSIALVFRKKQNDYTFPKGHWEDGESIEETAIRETEEETKRIPLILKEFPPYKEEYISTIGEDCICYYFYALDNGKSDNQSLDCHDVVWVDFDLVEKTLTYNNLKQVWREVKDNIKKILD